MRWRGRWGGVFLARRVRADQGYRLAAAAAAKGWLRKEKLGRVLGFGGWRYFGNIWRSKNIGSWCHETRPLAGCMAVLNLAGWPRPSYSLPFHTPLRLSPESTARGERIVFSLKHLCVGLRVSGAGSVGGLLQLAVLQWRASRSGCCTGVLDWALCRPFRRSRNRTARFRS